MICYKRMPNLSHDYCSKNNCFVILFAQYLHHLEKQLLPIGSECIITNKWIHDYHHGKKIASPDRTSDPWIIDLMYNVLIIELIGSFLLLCIIYTYRKYIDIKLTLNLLNFLNGISIFHFGTVHYHF